MKKKIRELVQRIYYYDLYSNAQSIGKNLRLSRGGKFNHPEEIIIGNNVFISDNFHISACELKIGDNIMVGPNLVIECTNHKTDVIGRTMFEVSHDKICKGVIIENDVWIGANVTLLPGVIISEGCVIGAGSIVPKSLPPYAICVGAPCRPIKKRFNEADLLNHLNSIQSAKYTHSEITDKWKLYNL